MRSDSPLLSGRSSILHRATATPLMTLRSVSREGLGRFLDGCRQLGRCLLETRIFDTARRFVEHCGHEPRRAARLVRGWSLCALGETPEIFPIRRETRDASEPP